MLSGNGSIGPVNLTNGTFHLPPPVMGGAGVHRTPVGGFVEASNDPDTWRNGLLTLGCEACGARERMCDECTADIRSLTNIG